MLYIASYKNMSEQHITTRNMSYNISNDCLAPICLSDPNI